MSETDLVLVMREEAIAIVTLNNPARLNAYSAEMRGALRETLSALLADKAVRAIVLTGAGPNFSAGGDLNSRNFNPAPLLEAREIPNESQQIVKMVMGGPKPVVAAIEGYAYGAGMALSAASDYVVASSGAKFSAAFIKVGLLPDVSIMWTLAQRVGPGRAKELLALGSVIDGTEAHRIGLVSKLVEPGQALAGAIEMAKLYAAGPPITLALLKAAFFNGMPTIADCWRAEADYLSIVWQTQDSREGVAAFKEKRKPVFTGE